VEDIKLKQVSLRIEKKQSPRKEDSEREEILKCKQQRRD